MQKKQNIGLVWFRNDLRVSDNDVLHLATSNHEILIACYCFDPRHFENGTFGFKKTEKFRAKFLIDSVSDLKTSLKAMGIELFIFLDKPENSIPKLLEEWDISKVYLQKEWTPEEGHVLNQVKSRVSITIRFYESYTQFLYHPETIEMKISEIPMVFTDFRKHVEKYARVRPLTAEPQYRSSKVVPNTTRIPTLADLGFQDFEQHPLSAFPFTGGERSAFQRLNYYIFETKKLGVYKKTRNGLIGTNYSSKLSPWLANGSLSVRTVYWNVKRFEEEHEKNQSTYWLIFELIWRDYFKYVSLKYGNSIFHLRGIRNREYEWERDVREINNWINGKTGSSFVNANMLELQQTGWMSNRGRQNVASYFSKDMRLDWRIGASYFESLLIDYDVHSNYGNWMYVSGVGNDPRDRKFDVEWQANRYDPSGKFQNLWLQPTLF
ncbi:DASH family cryptochrome [Aestuariivivens sediminicola]|uniref:DASH family cryptochrome n=1 Tax=Aestuariivivens sediminicola TaxID=2913560 RepID=UPI001F56BA2A|nr:DASH family cryptochrome [Aestuariivivens sediminicola]